MAAQAPPSPDQPIFRQAIDVVIVEATVTDRSGSVVPDLTADDFAVEIGGERREIVSVELVEHQAPAAGDPLATEGPVVSINTESSGRRLLLAVDQSSLAPDNRVFLDAARRWLRTLGPDDRLGLVALPPPGPVVEFTTNHQLVADALEKVIPGGGIPPAAFSTRNVGLWEAVRIRERDAITRALVIERECRPADRVCEYEIDEVARDIAGDVLSKTGPTLGSLRNMILAMRPLPAPKHVVLLSAGWPLDPQGMGSQLEPLAAAAATADVMLHALLAERSATEASMRRLSPSSAQDRNMLLTSVETLAGWTGGQSVRFTGTGDNAFDVLNRALGGYYRLGVQAEPKDLDGRVRRISVKVSRRGASIRAHRRIFAAATEAEVLTGAGTDASAALQAALVSAAPHTALALRATSYLLHEDESASDRLRVLVAVHVGGATEGAASVRMALFDEGGHLVTGIDRDLNIPEGGGAQVSAALHAPPGVYTLRVAARDLQGRLGTVHRDVDVRWRTVGEAQTTGLALFHVGAAPDDTPAPVIDDVSRDRRLIAQISLAEQPAGAAAEPAIEIAAEGISTPLLRRPLRLGQATETDRWLAQGVISLAFLPPGRYLVSAVLAPGTPPLQRAIVVQPAVAPSAGAFPAGAERTRATAPGSGMAGPGSSGLALGALAKPMPFDRASVLDPARVAPVLAQLGTRLEDGRARGALQRMAAGPWPRDPTAAPLAAAPVAAHFVAGLGRLQGGDLEGAAAQFRLALKQAPDFGPAMAYLAACYAAGGKDKEAAGAWQVALVRERGSLWLQRLAIEAWLRADRPAAALALLEQARRSAPDDDALAGLQVRAELAEGRTRQALETLASMKDPEPSLLLAGMAAIYMAAEGGAPVWDAGRDRALMERWRDTYAAIGGASLSLVDSWVTEMSARGSSPPP